MGKLTIVLTTYNRPNFLKLAIDAILSQTFTDFELVILDNGSDERTSKIINQFNDNRIISLRTGKNDFNFVNKAFEYTKNQYLMITHDDDIMEKNLIETHIKKLDSNKKIGMISCCLNLIDEEGKQLNKIRPRIKKDKIWSKHEFLKEFLFRGDIIPCPATIFRSSLIKKNELKYNFEVGPAHDLFLIFRINLLDYYIYLSKDPMYKYRIHNSQHSNLNRISLEYNIRPHAIKLFKNHNLNKIAKKYTQASLGLILQILINDYFVGKMKFNDFKNELIKLINNKIKFNIYTIYWGSIGIIRGLKNKFF
jgi:glycosyltransferase involved in cell wall biosynthesis